MACSPGRVAWPLEPLGLFGCRDAPGGSFAAIAAEHPPFVEMMPGGSLLSQGTIGPYSVQQQNVHPGAITSSKLAFATAVRYVVAPDATTLHTDKITFAQANGINITSAQTISGTGASGNALTNAPASTITFGVNPNTRFGPIGSLQITAFPPNAVVMSDATSIITPAAAKQLTDGALLIGNTGAAPTVAQLTQGAGVTITSVAGAITISSSGGAIVSTPAPAGTFLAGPVGGPAAVATFRSITVSDLPNSAVGYLTVDLFQLNPLARRLVFDGTFFVPTDAGPGNFYYVTFARDPTFDSITLTDLTKLLIFGGPLNTGTVTMAALTAPRTWTLPDASGTFPLGTGATNQVAYWTGTNVQAGSANLTFDGTILTALQYARVGTATDAAAQGDLSTGLAGAARAFYKQSTALLGLWDSTGTQQFWFDAANKRLGIGAAPSFTLQVVNGAVNAIVDTPQTVWITAADRDPTGTGSANVFIDINDAWAINKGGSLCFGGRYGTAGGAGTNYFAGIKGAKENVTDGDRSGFLAFYARAGGALSELGRFTSGGSFRVGTATDPGVADTGSAVLGLTGGTRLFWDRPNAALKFFLDGTVDIGSSVARPREIWSSLRAESNADQTVTNSTVLVSSTSLTVSLLASGRYRFRAFLFWTDSVATSGISLALSGTATVTDLKAEILISNDTTNAYIAMTRVTAFGSAVGAAGSGTTNHAIIEGDISVNAAGTFLIQFAQNVAAAATSVTLQARSYLIVERIA